MTEEQKQSKENSRVPITGIILKGVFSVVATVILLVGAYHGLNSYIDSRIDSKIHNADFLKKLARNVRPSLVFDENGSILADMGAVPFVSNISVSKESKGNLKITVSPAEYLGIQPVLEALDGQYVIRAERGQKFDWVFHLAGVQRLLLASSPKPEKGRFRLEIIR
jgi:hypothetical protein